MPQQQMMSMGYFASKIPTASTISSYIPNSKNYYDMPLPPPPPISINYLFQNNLMCWGVPNVQQNSSLPTTPTTTHNHTHVHVHAYKNPPQAKYYEIIDLVN